MERKLLGIVLAIVLIFSLAACTSPDEPEDNNDPIENEETETPSVDDETEEEDESTGDQEDSTTDKDEEIEEDDKDKDGEEDEADIEETEREVTLYFANKEYIETGDESLEKLIEEKRVVEYDDMTLPEAIVEELMEGPENDELETVIPITVILLDVKVSDSTAFVNFAQNGLSGGSMQESFTIMQIVDSLLELEEIEKVQFLIDGEEAETLMGHVDISKAFSEKSE